MKRIYKYEIQLQANQTLVVPGIRVKFLSLQPQNGRLCAWCIMEPSSEYETEYLIQTFGTGHSLPTIFHEAEFLGTVQEPAGFVWHVFYTLLKHKRRNGDKS